MSYPARLIWLIEIAVILSVGAQAPAKGQTASPQDDSVLAAAAFSDDSFSRNRNAVRFTDGRYAPRYTAGERDARDRLAGGRRSS